MATSVTAPAAAGNTTRAHRVVVVGNGMAGARTVDEILLRRRDQEYEVTMFGDEPYGNYNRILLSGVLAGQDEPEDIFINSLDWYRDNGIDLRAGVRVVSIDRGRRLVTDDRGDRTPYDTLILAMGSRAFVPPIPGLHTPAGTLRDGVFVFRTLDDCTAIAGYARGCTRAAVIGGGLLGLEAAKGLMNHGLEVIVVEAAPHLMAQQIDGHAGRTLARTLRELGISVRTGVATSELIERDGAIAGLRFADGGEMDCDMVVVAAGIRPNAELARDAGLQVERAIVVDDQMRTADPHILAVGEVAQHRGVVYGLVAPLFEQATVLAERFTGVRPDAAYTGSKLATKLKVMGADVAVMGVREPERDEDEHITYSDPSRGVHMSAVVRDGLLVGATLLGDIGRAPFLTQLFDKGTPVPADRRELLFELGGPAVDDGVAALPDDAQICNCNGVSKGDIVGCVRAGTASVTGVMKATRAGTGCGSCKDRVAQLVELAADGAVEIDPAAEWYVPGVPLAKPDLVREIRSRDLRSVSAVFDALADGRDDPGSKMGLTSLLRTLWGPEELGDERDARFINDRVHGNIQKDGTFSVVPGISGGVTNARELRRIADVAEKYGVSMIKITGGQRIDLLGVAKEDLPRVWADLGMRSGHAYAKSFRTVKTCVGSEFCRFGVGDSTRLGIDLEERYKGLESPAKMKLAVSGCPRNCAESLVKDVGVVAVEGGRWEIHVGGAAGATVRRGDLLCTVDTPEEVLLLTGRFMQYYRERARWLERTYDFVPRIGIDRLREIIVDDAEGLAAGLDAAVARDAEAYVDPWAEGRSPASAAQFTTLLGSVR